MSSRVFLAVFESRPSTSRRTARLSGRLLLRALDFYLQAARSQQLVHIEQHHQAPRNFSQPGDAVQSALLKNRWRSFDRFGRNLQDLRGRIDDEPGESSAMLDHQDAILFFQHRPGLPEALAQVHDRDDFSAQIDHAFEIVRRIRHGGDLGHAHNFVQRGDRHAVGLASYLKAHDMKFTTHAYGSMLRWLPVDGSLGSGFPTTIFSIAIPRQPAVRCGWSGPLPACHATNRATKLRPARSGRANPAARATSSTSAPTTPPIQLNRKSIAAPVPACAPWP